MSGACVTASPETSCSIMTVAAVVGRLPVNFIYISSLSIFGPIREKDYSSICETDTPRPNTAYGLSKLHTEEYLKSLTNFPYVIFRPTGVYGPRERDYFLMAKSVQQHVDFAAGFKRQDITFVFVKDFLRLCLHRSGIDGFRADRLFHAYPVDYDDGVYPLV